jgi:hypothetical protein
VGKGRSANGDAGLIDPASSGDPFCSERYDDNGQRKPEGGR